MLAIEILGSSSKGNSYILKNNNSGIMLDCGVMNSFDKIDITQIKGILISHRHL